MNLDSIAQVITEAGLGAPGKTLFMHHMPETCAKGVLLRLPMEGIPTNQYIPGYYNGSFQAIVRDKNHASGQDLADRLSKLLTFYERNFADKKGRVYQRILQCYPCQKPIVYPRLPDNLIEWSIKFDVDYLEL